MDQQQGERREGLARRGSATLRRVVDAATRDRLLARVGLALQQLGESEPPDPGQLVERVLHRGRGGDCFEANTVLPTLLEALGFTVERGGDDGWWITRHESGTSPGLRFADAPASRADFQPHHERLSTSADSSFVPTLVVQQPGDDRVVTLRARTRFVDGPGVCERQILDDEPAVAAALRDRCGVDPAALGPERVSRLWAQAEEQHAAHQALTRSAPAPR